MDISKSENRIKIEEFILTNMDEMSPEQMSVKLFEDLGISVQPHDITDYIKNYIKKGNSLVSNMTKMVDDVLSANIDMNVLEATKQFSISQINEEFKLIYDRINTLYQMAKLDPEKASYDKRITDYLERANQLRNIISKDYITEIKNNLMLDIGKRIVLSAIANFIPYIPEDKRVEAKDKFMNSLSFLFNNYVDSEPENVSKIKKEYGKTEENK